MKFRATITDFSSIRLFAQLLNIVSKWTKQFVFRIGEDRVLLVVSEKDSIDNRASAFCEMSKESIFDDFAMEGVTSDDNEIYLEVSSAIILTCVSSLKGTVNSVKIKLTKKVVPCLTFEVESSSINSNIMCVHDCPVNIVTRRNWGEYSEPDIPHFDISMGIPDIAVLRNALDRLKVLGQRLSIEATKDGKLSLSVDNLSINCAVHFSDLRIYNIERDEGSSISEPNDSDNSPISVEVDMKHIQSVIPTESLKPSTFMISFIHHRMAHLLFVYGDVSLQYCLPGLM